MHVPIGQPVDTARDYVTVLMMLAVVCTVMMVLHVIHVNTIAVVVLLFLFYIPEDVFAERVLGMR